MSQVPNNPNHIYNMNDQEVKAIVHNTSLRLYELSTILDGILNFMKTEMNVPFNSLHNYVYISRIMKEWHMETGEMLDVLQAKAKFLGGEEFDMASERIKIDITQFLADRLENLAKEGQVDGREEA